MKQFLIFFITTISICNLSGQILNNEFDQWITIDTSGQPYFDLVDWNTNNEGLGSGLATTPCVRIEEGADVGISIMTDYRGTDGFYSGVVSQTIDAEKLIDVSYLSKCDSIFERGACVVNVYDESEVLIFTDSLKRVESDYSLKVIDLSDINNVESGTIRLEFIAFGQIGLFEPFQGYSEFRILNVNANYISSTPSLTTNGISIKPNPFGSLVTINAIGPIDYYLFNAHGQLVLEGERKEIDTKDIPRGIYFLQIHKQSKIVTKKLMKH